MKSENKSFLLKLTTSVVLGLVIFFWLGDQIFLNESLITNIITLLSIFFGFYITSFSIFTTSRYVAQLYKLDDLENNRRQSLMHTLIHKYKLGLIITLVSIIYILVILLVSTNKTPILLKAHWYLILFLPIMILNFIYAFEMMGILVKVIKQTAKLNQEPYK